MQDWIEMIDLFTQTKLSDLIDKITLLDILSTSCISENIPLLNFLINQNDQLTYQIIINEQNISSIFNQSVCGKQLTNSPAIKCQTCSNDLASVICLDCFDENKHIGHKYTYLTANGMCDCGFACTIKPEGFCSKHCGNHVIRDFEEEKQLFNEEMCIKVIYTLTCLLAYHLINKNTERYRGICSVIRKLLYDHPIDFLKSIFTKCLFISPEQSTIENMINFGNFQDHILPYYNLYNLRTNIQETGFKHIPLICIICQSEEFISDQGENDISHYLVEFQISEPNFRSLMMYSFYMRYQDLICQCFGKDKNQMHKLFSVKLNDVQYFIQRPDMFEKQIWCSAPVQLDSNIQLDNQHGIAVNFIELISYYLTQIQCHQHAKTKEQRFIDTKFIQAFYNHGIEEFYKINQQTSLKSNQELIKQMEVLFHNSLLYFTQTLPVIKAFDDDIESIQLRLNVVREMCYSLLCHIYSMKNSQFDAQISCFKLPILAYSMLVGLNFVVEVKRLRDVQVLQYDVPIKDIMQQLIYNSKYFYDFAYEIYTGIIYGYKQPTYNFESSICRVNDDFDQIDLSQNKYYQKQINNVVELSVYFLLVYSLNQRFQFCYSNNNYYPQIPYGFGLHTQIPIIETDLITVDYDVLHPVDNQLIIQLSFGLQAYHLYKSNDMFDQSIEQFFTNIVEQIQFTRSLPKYNMTIITGWSIRTILSLGLLESGFFKSLIDVEEYIKCFLYQHPRVLYFNPIYHHFVVLQVILLTTSRGTYTANHFISQLFEQFGLLNPQTNQLCFKNSKEDQTKLFQLFMFSIRVLMQTVMKSQLLNTHSDLIIQYILSFLIIKQQISPSEIHKFFGEMDFYNAERFQQLFQVYSNFTSFENINKQFYKSSNMQIQCEINITGLSKLSMFDSFCSNLPQFLSSYKTFATKFNVSILPIDVFDDPFNAEISIAVFTNIHVQNVIQFLIEKLFISREIDSLNVLNDIYVLLAFKQILRLNDGDLQLIKLFNDIPKDKNLYQDQVWLVLKNLMEQQQQNKQQVNKISMVQKLAQLKQKTSHTNELICNIQESQIEDDFSYKTVDLLNKIKIINSNFSNCQICQEVTTKMSTLCVLGTITPINLNCKRSLISQSCTHIFHYNCTKIDQGMIVCPICRSISTAAFPLKFSSDIDESVSVIISLIINIISVNPKFNDSDILQVLSHIQKGLIQDTDFELLDSLLIFLLQVSIDQLVSISSRIQYDEINPQSYKNKQFQIVLLTSYSIILSVNCLCNYLYSQNLEYRQISNLSQNTLFQTLIVRLKSSDNIIQILQTLFEDSPCEINSDSYCNLINEIKNHRDSLNYQIPDSFSSFQEQFNLCILFNKLQDVQLPKYHDIGKYDLKIFDFPQNYSTILKSSINCECGQKAICFCTFCGTGLCHQHIENFSHSSSCQQQGCFYVYKYNILLFTDFKNHIYFTGGPFLDDNGEDDIQRIKKIPLYRNDQLINNLKSHLLYLNTRQQSQEQGVQLTRLLQLMATWE